MEKSSESKKVSAVVVGGSSGIGYETCLRLVNRGFHVTNISRTACEIPKVQNIVADVVVGNTFHDAICQVGESCGIHVLIYCAGFSMASPIEYAKENDYRYLFDVNYFGAVQAIQSCLPFMKNKGGKIILVGSLGGEIPIVYDSFYSSSKAALEMLARSARLELSQYHIQVTAVLPGGTATNFTYKRKVYSDHENKAYAKSVNKAVAALANMEQSGMTAGEVAEQIFRIAIQEKTPMIKVCGLKNNTYRFATRIMPEKWTLFITERVYHQ